MDYKRWTENSFEYSDHAQHEWRTGGRRYVSAEDAVDQYLRLKSELQGSPAIDYERAMGVDTSPDPENPASLKAHEAFFLEKMFARARRKLRDYQWRVWGVIRVHYYSLREAARDEQKHRRQEIQRIHSEEALQAWCEHYEKQYPGGADPWEALLEDPGISAETARRYRDKVDAQIEQQLVGEGSLVRNDVRDEDEARIEQDFSLREDSDGVAA